MTKLLSLVLILGHCHLASSQTSSGRHYLDKAQISDDASTGTMIVVANAPLPLLDALIAVRSRYGWAVNWEEAPLHSRFDTYDCTDPAWRSKHPGEKGATCASGAFFTSSLARIEGQPGVGDEKATLEKLVDDYNKSDNPGKYEVFEADGGLAIVGVKARDEKGILREVTPLLNTVLELPPGKRNVRETIDTILKSLSSSTGAKTGYMSWATHDFDVTEVDLGGHPATARQLLNEALASTGRPFTYRLGFSVEDDTYYLNTDIARKTVDNGHGILLDQPIDRQ